MAYVGEKAISSKNIKVMCPHCGAIQTEKIYIFKSDIYENTSSGDNILRCFKCKEFYIRLSNGTSRKV
jgi:uncharacterized C2H2 Zn-finger protein